MSLSPTAQRWAKLVVALDQSKLTARAFAAQHNVSASTLSWWRGRFRGTLKSRGFVAVDLPAVMSSVAPVVPPTPPRRPLLLEFTGRPIVLAIPADTDLAWLRAVVDTLS
jgi:hypothetical protein